MQLSVLFAVVVAVKAINIQDVKRDEVSELPSNLLAYVTSTYEDEYVSDYPDDLFKISEKGEVSSDEAIPSLLLEYDSPYTEDWAILEDGFHFGNIESETEPELPSNLLAYATSTQLGNDDSLLYLPSDLLAYATSTYSGAKESFSHDLESLASEFSNRLSQSDSKDSALASSANKVTSQAETSSTFRTSSSSLSSIRSSSSSSSSQSSDGSQRLYCGSSLSVLAVILFSLLR